MLNLTCAICTELFSQSDNVHATVCGHLFHFACLSKWMERSKSCPQCRNKCTQRDLTRIYFNNANLDTSRIDIGSLQEQLDNANLQIKLKDQELYKVTDKVANLKESQRMCKKTISALEAKLKSNEFVILSFADQVKLLKADAKQNDDLRKELKKLKQQIETLESVSTILTASQADVEKMLKNERDPQRLGVWVSTLKRELRLSESKRVDLRNLLKVVQADLRREIDLKKEHEERLSQLESENYQLNEKIILLGSSEPKTKQSTASPSLITNVLLDPLMRQEKRFSISPTVKENLKKIEESKSPYLSIKSSSIGLLPLFNRSHDVPAIGDPVTKATTTKFATLKVSPGKRSNACVLGASDSIPKTSSDLGERYSIFKKPRLGSVVANVSAGSACMLKPSPNYIFNGFGGSEKLDPFAAKSDDDDVPTEGIGHCQPRDSLILSKKSSLAGSFRACSGMRFKTKREKTKK